MIQEDGPREFETRALAVARAIHDPSGLQGAEMLLGKERDGIFIDSDSIHVYEFSISTLKAKAEKDAKKTAEALAHLTKRPASQFKTATGWVVFSGEPSAEQRGAVRQVSDASGFTIHCLGYQTLRSRLCNVETYLAARDVAPFGSTAYISMPSSEETTTDIPIIFRDQDAKEFNVQKVRSEVSEGKHVLITGEFGIGKSHSVRNIYREMRKRYFKNPAENPFPIHVNLRDCAGLKSPSEVFRRHAEEVGFNNERGLLSAWKAGAAALLLDGFDEVIPSRWLGPTTSLRTVRRDALSPIRRLIEESPKATGVVAAGRGNYFSSDQEIVSCLGLMDPLHLSLTDFDADQAAALIRAAGIEAPVPAWLPARPLLLTHLVSTGLLDSVAGLGEQASASDAWRQLLTMICDRESRIYPSVEPLTIRHLIRKLATVARAKGDPLAALEMEDLARAFFDLSGRKADEEVNQLLMRLPGLAVSPKSGGGEARIFADADLASTAFGEELATYLMSPFTDSPLAQAATWSDTADTLGIEVCAAELVDQSATSSQVLAACDRRMNMGMFDAILMDAIRTADEIGANASGKAYRVEGVLVKELEASPAVSVLSQTHITDAIIEVLDLHGIEDARTLPTLERCAVGRAEGISALTPAMSERFPNTTIEAFAHQSSTTSGILALTSGPQEKVALSVLHKIYARRGTGRKDSALPRGLDPVLQGHLPDVLQRLVASNLVAVNTRGGTKIYLPTKGNYARVFRWLENPSAFSLSSLAVDEANA